MTYRSGHTVRTLCEVTALDARFPEIWLTPVTVVTGAGKAGMYLANDSELEVMTRAMADFEARVALETDQLIVDLDVTPHQEAQDG